MTTTQPAPAPLRVDDLHRINDALDRVALLDLGDRIAVQISAPAEPRECVECPTEWPVPGDVAVHHGHAQACYLDWLCYGCLGRFLATRLRHDLAQPVVDVPAAVIQ